MNEMLKIEQHPCGRKGCTEEATNHYHCGRCTSPAVTSMLGHFRRDSATGREWYTCKPEDLPTAEVVAAEKAAYPLITVQHVVSTVEELEALPVHTVIVGVGDKFENEHSDMTPTVFQRQDLECRSAWWRSPDYVEAMTSTQLVTIRFLPARYTVVWMPPTEEGR